MKYVIGQNPATKHFHPIIFPDEVNHCDAANALPVGDLRIGAGSYNIEDKIAESIKVYGCATSMDGLSPGKNDALILELFIFREVSGMALANYIMALQLGIESP